MAKRLVDQIYWDAAYAGIGLTRAGMDDPVRQWIEHNIPTGEGHCLEVGCFPGRYLSVLGELGYTLHGLDQTPGVAKVLPEWLRSEGFKTGEFTQGDFLSFDLCRKYDIVCSFGFVEHFVDYETVLLRHMALVGSGGYLVITCPNFRGWVQRILHLVFDRANFQRHHIPSMNPRRWSILAEKNGFRIVNCGYFGVFDFWVDTQERNSLQRYALGQIEKQKSSLRKLCNTDRPAWSPYCGLIARRMDSKGGCDMMRNDLFSLSEKTN